MTVIVISFVVFLIGHLADWQLQCEQHGWPGLAWTRYQRGARWPWYADWIPHDCWHWAQTIDNWCPVTSAVLLNSYGPFEALYNIGLIVPVYAVARFAGFTVPRKLSLGY